MALASVYFDVHLRCYLFNEAKITCASLYEFGYVQNIPDSFTCGHQKRSGTVSTHIRYVTLHFRDSSELRSVSEIAPKSPFSYVDRSLI